jgi:hypothetical protein
MKIRLVGAELFHADRRTDIRKFREILRMSQKKIFLFFCKLFLFITTLINNNNLIPETVIIDWFL